MEEKQLQLRQKIVLREKKKPILFSFKGLFKIKCSWTIGGVSSDLDLCVFYKRKDGGMGGVFSAEYRQKISDQGSLEAFPFMLHKGDMRVSSDNPVADEQVHVVNLDEIQTAYVCVLAYDAAIEQKDVSFSGCNGKVELLSEEGDYFEVPIDTQKSGHLYLVCTINNENGENSVINEGEVMDLGEAYNRIPAFNLLVK